MATYSPHTDRVLPGSTKFDRRRLNVQRLIIHHTAGGSNEGNEQNLAYKNDDVSASYVMRTDGTLTGIIPEELRPWTTGAQDGAYSADDNSVTVETVNIAGAPNWEVSNESLEGLAVLAADLSSRYGWGPLTRTNVKGHREFKQTACPGPFLYDHLEYICARANEILGGSPAAPSVPETGPSTPVAPAPAGNPGWNAWDGVNFNLDPGHYYGPIDGPAESHGGAYPEELAPIKWIQRNLQNLGFAPNVEGWADGLYEQPTSVAVSAFQKAHMPGTEFYGQVWGDDWAMLASLVNSPPAPAQPTPAAPGPAPAAKPGWPAGFGPNDFLGLITGPAESHGGDTSVDGPDVVAAITYVQQQMQAKGYAPADPSWADGVYEQPTVDAVAAWQHAEFEPQTSLFGQVWSDDFSRL